MDKQDGALRAEMQLVSMLAEELHRRGFQVAQEVPSMGASVDLVARRNHALFAFEVKLKDWRRALHQASFHDFVADYALIVIPKRRANLELHSLALARGIGVLEFDGSGTWSMPVLPRRSRKIWRPQRKKFIGEFERYSNAS